MLARLAAPACVLALLAPGTALAQGGGAFDPIPPAPPPQQPTTVAPTAQEDEDEGLSSTQQLLIALAGIVVLLGIAWAIVRDARSAAPAQPRGAVTEEGPQPKGSRKPAGVRHRQSRAKAKAARQARKRARKR